METVLFFLFCVIALALFRVTAVLRKTAESRDEILKQSCLHLLEINERLRWMHDEGQQTLKGKTP